MVATNRPISDNDLASYTSLLADDGREWNGFSRSELIRLAAAADRLLAEVKRQRAVIADQQPHDVRLLHELDAARDEITFQRDINQQIGAENEQLQAQLEAARGIVAVVASHTAFPGAKSGLYMCLFCTGAARYISDIQHDDNCIAEQARTFVAQYPAGK